MNDRTPEIIDYSPPPRPRSPRYPEMAAVVLGTVAIALLGYGLSKPWNAIAVAVTATIAVGGFVSGIIALVRAPRHWPLLVLGLCLCGLVIIFEGMMAILWFSDW